jgi:3-oxoacyl-[acyl-carrier-protein] synthase II
MMTTITGIGWVTADGMGCGRMQTRFRMPSRPLAPVKREAVYSRPYKNFGRMDEYSRLGLAAVTFALRDAGLEDWQQKRSIGIVAATEYGCLWTDFDYYATVLPEGGRLASPNLFSYTLPNCFLGEAAIRFGLTGESFVIYEPSGCGLAAVQLASDILTDGDTAAMLCGICDLGRPPVLRRSAPVATGALFFVLEACPDSNKPVYGNLDTDAEGGIRFNRSRIDNPAALANACLAAAHDPAGTGTLEW